MKKITGYSQEEREKLVKIFEETVKKEKEKKEITFDNLIQCIDEHTIKANKEHLENLKKYMTIHRNIMYRQNKSLFILFSVQLIILTIIIKFF